MTIRWITDDDRRRAADVRREMAERERVEIAFADWVIARSAGERPVHVPRLSEEMIARLRTLLHTTCR
jgi:hypothetical protein